jgi:RND family efflux transporter MFP subunit
MPPEALPRLIRSLHGLAGPGAAGVTDAELLDRFVAARDEAAFELLLWRHGPMVLGVCRRVLRHEADADDAFQATFLALARKAASIGRREAVGSWLAQVAYRVALQVREDVARRAARELPDVAVRVRGWDDLGEVLDEEINRLPARQRAAFVLCCLEGKSGEEAARELRCAPGTVSSRLTRARERLRRALVRRGVAPEGAASAALVAAVPEALVSRTLGGVAGAAGAVSARVAGYTEGVLRAMLLTRLKVVCACVLLAGLVALGGAMAAQAIDRPEAPPGQQPVAKAEAANGPPVVKPKRGGLPHTVWQIGEFQAVDRQEVYAAVSGTLKDLSVDLGSRVKKGQLLGRIDAPALVLAEKEAALAVRRVTGEVEEAKAKLTVAEAEASGAREAFEEAKALRGVAGTGWGTVKAKSGLEAKEGNVSLAKATLAGAKIKVEEAELALEKARLALGLTRLMATVDGVVTQRNFHEGQYVQAGEGSRQLLLTIQGTGRYRLRLSVLRRQALSIKPGAQVKVSFDPATDASPVECTVSRIGHAFDSGDKMQVEIDVADPSGRIRPGMKAEAKIQTPGHPGALRIPLSSFNLSGGRVETPSGVWDSLYVFRNGKPELRRVAIGAQGEKEVEILAGLKETDLVLKDPYRDHPDSPGRTRDKDKAK